MLQATWIHIDIDDEATFSDMQRLFRESNIIAGAFDTETSGLHILLDKPFLFQFGWLTNNKTGFTFAVDLEQNNELARRVITQWHTMAATLPIYLAHNTKFDMHMLENIGLGYFEKNLSDTRFYIHYAHDAVSTRKGGAPLKLKEYASRYIDSSAKHHERLLDKEKTDISKVLNNRLKTMLQGCKPPEKYHARSYTLSVFNEMFKDVLFTADQLPEDARRVYYTWLNDVVPVYLQDKVTGLVESDMIPYNKLNRTNLKKYAHLDVVWVLEAWLKLDPVVKARENEIGLNIENRLIIPLFEMERVGFKTNKPYLEDCRVKVAAYIRNRREIFYELAGEELKIGQHAKIADLFRERFGHEVNSTDGDVLKQLRSELIRNNAEEDKPCIEFINVLEELRTLEKWYTTYILRFLQNLKHTDRLYTTIDQVGTVSGRVSSDFQQFPKDPIQTVDGEELFAPRRMIEVSGGDYGAIVYLDYSQIELRFQALYTILVGHPDTNLCRAYMPYKCLRKTDSGKLIPFNYENPQDIKDAYCIDWYYEEAPEKKWTPLDVHGATTKAAFDIDENHPDYKHLRYVGKRVNFAKNYGAKYGKICTMFPERSAEECRRIDAAYYIAFPGVKQYHEYCYNRAQYAYTTNLFGVRYYNVSGHNLINMLVQGSAAYYLKLKILELYEYSKAHNLKTRWQMQIHDELSWEKHIDDDPAVFFEFKRIMEDWTDGCIPVVADMEITTKSWFDKVEVATLDELKKELTA